MLEYPEMYTLAKQMKQALTGRLVAGGTLVSANSNLFMDAQEPERYKLLCGGKVCDVEFYAPEIYIALDNGYGILICACGGKFLFSGDAQSMPKKHTIRFDFEDGAVLTYTMALWSLGVIAYSQSQWEERKRGNERIKFQPLGEDSFEKYIDFIRANEEQSAMAIKVFLSKFIAGIMSGYAAEILLYAGVHPSVPLKKLDESAHLRIYDAMRRVLLSACEKGGKSSEVTLFNERGGYTAFAQRKNIGKPCPLCGQMLDKISAGGVTAYCPQCQKK